MAKKVSILWLVACVLLCIPSLIATTVFAVVLYQKENPYIFDLQFVPGSIQLVSTKTIDYSYNSTSQQYEYIYFWVENTDNSPHSASIKLAFINNLGYPVAKGLAPTGNVLPGTQMQIAVPLDWNMGYTVTDLENVVQPHQQIIPLT